MDKRGEGREEEGVQPSGGMGQRTEEEREKERKRRRRLLGRTSELRRSVRLGQVRPWREVREGREVREVSEVCACPTFHCHCGCSRVQALRSDLAHQWNE